MTTETFAWYIREQVAPQLRSGQVVVLDHLSAHKAASIRQAIEARGCALLFLPPYSPDCTPIEQAFSKLKAILRARSRCAHPRRPAGGGAAGHRGHYCRRRGGGVRPCGIPPTYSTNLKVALSTIK